MNREKCLEEMIRSMIIGGVIGMFGLAFVHQQLRGPLEMVVYWIATWGIATYGTWSVIDWMDRRR